MKPQNAMPAIRYPTAVQPALAPDAPWRCGDWLSPMTRRTISAWSLLGRLDPRGYNSRGCGDNLGTHYSHHLRNGVVRTTEPSSRMRAARVGVPPPGGS